MVKDLTWKQAQDLAWAHWCASEDPDGLALAPYGWEDSEAFLALIEFSAFLDTGDPLARMVGNPFLLVWKATGATSDLGHLDGVERSQGMTRVGRARRHGRHRG